MFSLLGVLEYYDPNGEEKESIIHTGALPDSSFRAIEKEFERTESLTACEFNPKALVRTGPTKTDGRSSQLRGALRLLFQNY
jgi:hypothetical protein